MSIFSEIAPVSRLDEVSMATRLLRVYNDSGKLPIRELSPTPMTLSADKSPIAVGIDPVKELDTSPIPSRAMH